MIVFWLDTHTRTHARTRKNAQTHTHTHTTVWDLIPTLTGFFLRAPLNVVNDDEQGGRHEMGKFPNFFLPGVPILQYANTGYQSCTGDFFYLSPKYNSFPSLFFSSYASTCTLHPRR